MQRDLPRHFTAYTIAIIVYIAMIAAFLYTQTQTLVTSKDTKEKVLEMTLSSFVPDKKEEEKVIKEVPEPIEEEVEEEPVVKPEPIVKKPVKKPIIKPLKKVVKKKPVKKKIVKKKLIKKKKVQQKPKKTAKKKTAKKKVSKKQASSKQTKSSAGKRNAFYNQLRSKIDKHKFYPRIAKKRRMEGSVKVRFTILSNGKVGKISVSGPKIFYKSAKNAVKSAFPLRIKNMPISLPTTVNLTLRYQIR